MIDAAWLDARLAALRGRAGVCVLSDGAEVAARADVPFRLASVVKVPIALAVLRDAERGRIDLRERVEISRVLEDDDGGVLARLRDGDAVLTVRALVVLMLVVSDNTAANLLLDRVGMDRVNDRLDELGLSAIRVRRRLLDRAAAARGEENVGTCRALARMMDAIASGRALGADATAELLATMRGNNTSVVRRALPAGARVADKNGELDGMRAAVALLEDRVALAVVADDLADDRDGEAFIADVARAALQ